MPCSISNLGMYPVDKFCAIINPPQVFTTSTLLEYLDVKLVNFFTLYYFPFCLWSQIISTILLIPMFFHSFFKDDMINQFICPFTRLCTISTNELTILVNQGWFSPNLILFNKNKKGNNNWKILVFLYLNSHLVADLSWSYSCSGLFPYFVILSRKLFHFRMPVLLIWETVTQVAIRFGAWILKRSKCSVALD